MTEERNGMEEELNKGKALQIADQQADALPPEWLADAKVNEVIFCQELLRENPMVCYKGSFFTVDGRVSEERSLKKQIYEKLKPWVTQGLSKKVDNLLEVLRAEAYRETLPATPDRIHVANGTLFLDGRFTGEKDFCRNRLPVCFQPDAPEPKHWLRFTEELLEPEDILTLQEFMGYCLIPTTKAQKMLMIIGQGGEGKSRIGSVLRAIFGDSMANGSLAKVETNRFARADLEHMLVMVDDDMKLEALPQTNYLKLIITADLPLDLEKKSKQSYQGELCVRFICFGNGSIKALYDRSHGFFRRQIILTAKRKDPDRMDDPDLGDKLKQEKEGILLWCLEGLRRLEAQNYRFTISAKAQENMAQAISDGNNIVDFLASKGYVAFIPGEKASTKALYAVYQIWCEDNAVKPLSARSFSLYLAENADRYGLEPSNSIHITGGKRVRGFLGIKVLVWLPV